MANLANRLFKKRSSKLTFFSHAMPKSKSVIALSETAQDILWNTVRKRRMAGFRFARMEWVYGIVVDFYCEQAKLVVELEPTYNPIRDAELAEQDKLLAAHGIKVLRFPEVMIRERLDSVRNTILEELPNTK